MTAASSQTPLPQPIPATLKGYPVLSAIRDNEDDNLWTVLCQRTEQQVWVGAERYITWRAWWSDAHGCYEVENGHCGAGHGVTWKQACADLLQRAGLSPVPPQWPISDGPAQWHVIDVDGQQINVWVDRPAAGHTRIILTDNNGIACGDAGLGEDGLLLNLPPEWSPQDKANAAAFITLAAHGHDPGQSS